MLKIGKKQIYLITAFLLLGIVLAACTSAPTPTATQAPAPTNPPVVEPTAAQPAEPAPVAAPNKPANFVVFGPGTKNVPPGVPVYLRAGIAAPEEGAPADAPRKAAINVVPMAPGMGEINPDTGRPKGVKAQRDDANPPTTDGVGSGPYAWTLTKAPDGSKAALAKEVADVNGLGKDVASFTPDKEGEYVISLTVTDDKGTTEAGELTIVAAKYVGNEACKGCHKAQYDGWAQTKHGTAFERFVNENAEGEYFSAGYGCARCHTVGYYPVAESTGGWWEQLGSPDNWPKNDIALNAFNEEDGKDTFHTKFSTAVQAVSNIGCESCHGPASAHVAAPGPDTAPLPTAGSSSCLQCHNASGHHTRGGAMLASAHNNNADLGEGSNPSCARCHSAEGFVDTMAGKTEIRAINDDLGCATCHDPHSEENTFQLRTVGKVTVPLTPESDSFVVENAGLSAVCMNCHNSRRGANTVTDEKATRFTPHASTATEMIAGLGGYDWGFKIANSAHTNIGQGVINDEHSNQPGNMDFTQINGGQAPGACVLCHMYQTPGGVWDTKDSMKVPGHQQIGGHTFNMVTEQNGTKVENTAVCQQCHPGVTTFDFAATADYDGNGKVEGVQTEVNGLKELLKGAILAWKDSAGKSITLDDQGGFVTKDLKLTTDVKAAIYNYSFVGTSGATHNFNRTIGLLQVSYFKLTGKNVKDAPLMYSK